MEYSSGDSDEYLHEGLKKKKSKNNKTPHKKYQQKIVKI